MRRLAVVCVALVLPACDAVLGDLYDVDGGGADALPPVDVGARGDAGHERDSGRDATGMREAAGERDTGGAGDAPSGEMEAAPESSIPPSDASGDVAVAPAPDAAPEAAADAGAPDDAGREASTGQDACTQYCDPPDALDPNAVICAVGTCTGATDLACPAGSVVTGLTTAFDPQFMNALAIDCATLGVGTAPGFAVMATADGSTPTLGLNVGTATTSCPASAPAVVAVQFGLAHESGTGGLDRSGVVVMSMSCDPVSVKYAAPGQYTAELGMATVVAAGGSGTTLDSLACPAGKVATGVQATFDGISVNPVGLDCSSLKPTP